MGEAYEEKNTRNDKEEDMYPITIFNPRKVDKKEQKRLEKVFRKYDLEWDNIEFSGTVSEKNLKKIYAICDEEGLRLKIRNSLGHRRTDYRRRFFSENTGDIGGKYICAYCGKWLKKDKVVVDHLYPVKNASKSVEYQKKLRRHGIRKINDNKNLVASCDKCNRKKGTKGGLWILRGKIGRHRAVWFIRYFIRLLIILFGAYSLWYLYRVIAVF